ncbi:suppressor of fused domain protein [Micromonospora sp. WMMD961]|uniref:suppressor of fused domain protein n=1 Tax=Micromonospora sp. WMMD961 TaxID=3016100 RepID=UPI0024179C98|nr:suppressor of fused domain protein [Micromonospora sp. WMMD961]MDG4783923.1 suppressor of fused domain protein [Micromonospora sp. WMMD961]
MVKVADEAPGWAAIEAAVATRAGDQNPLHWGTNSLPGQGLYGLSAYRSAGQWLLVTFGMTELFSKSSDDPDVSGWGYELTMRVPRDADEPPAWSLRLLERLADYVFTSGKPFAEGHRMDPGGPITGQANTRLRALTFVADPELPPINSPHGSARFLTVVGITANELDRMKATTTAEVLSELAECSPMLVTDPTR